MKEWTKPSTLRAALQVYIANNLNPTMKSSKPKKHSLLKSIVDQVTNRLQQLVALDSANWISTDHISILAKTKYLQELNNQ
jgi:hypothetical protein